MENINQIRARDLQEIAAYDIAYKCEFDIEKIKKIKIKGVTLPTMNSVKIICELYHYGKDKLKLNENVVCKIIKGDKLTPDEIQHHIHGAEDFEDCIDDLLGCNTLQPSALDCTRYRFIDLICLQPNFDINSCFELTLRYVEYPYMDTIGCDGLKLLLEHGLNVDSMFNSMSSKYHNLYRNLIFNSVLDRTAKKMHTNYEQFKKTKGQEIPCDLIDLLKKVINQHKINRTEIDRPAAIYRSIKDRAIEDLSTVEKREKIIQDWKDNKTDKKVRCLTFSDARLGINNM